MEWFDRSVTSSSASRTVLYSVVDTWQMPPPMLSTTWLFMKDPAI